MTGKSTKADVINTRKIKIVNGTQCVNFNFGRTLYSQHLVWSIGAFSSVFRNNF